MTYLHHICIALICLHTAHGETPKNTKKSSTQDLVNHLLHQDLGTRKFNFSDVIQASSGKKVLPFETSHASHQTSIQTISQAAHDAITALNAPDSPVRKLRRINEASRYFEDHLRQSIQKNPSLTCTIPRNAQGNEQRSGYPDLLITHTSPTGKKLTSISTPNSTKKNHAPHPYAPSISNHAPERTKFNTTPLTSF